MAGPTLYFKRYLHCYCHFLSLFLFLGLLIARALLFLLFLVSCLSFFVFFHIFQVVFVSFSFSFFRFVSLLIFPFLFVYSRVFSLCFFSLLNLDLVRFLFLWRCVFSFGVSRAVPVSLFCSGLFLFMFLCFRFCLSLFVSFRVFAFRCFSFLLFSVRAVSFLFFWCLLVSFRFFSVPFLHLIICLLFLTPRASRCSCLTLVSSLSCFRCSSFLAFLL